MNKAILGLGTALLCVSRLVADTATWVGGGSDSLMTTLSNWQGSPASLDLSG